MSDIRKYEPLWGSWYVESMIGEGSFGKVYKVRKSEFGKAYYSAVKAISIPQNEAAIRQAKSEGLDDASARSYFHAFVVDIIQEVDLMSAFRGNSNIVSLEDHKVIEYENEIGWDILIRMELLDSLSERVTQRPLSVAEVVKLGVHICRALELCAVKRIIHRDIKPDNIFVSQYGEYKLGDFGIARQIERTMSGMSKKGTETYMAPEVFKGEDYGASVDTYSLGIVMYRYLNHNRPPFWPRFPNSVTPRDRESALQRRMKGEALPGLAGIDPALCDIVLKACAFDRKSRYSAPEEMRLALEEFSGEYGGEPVSVPPKPETRAAVPRAATVPVMPEPSRSYARDAKCGDESAYEPTESVFTSRVTADMTSARGVQDKPKEAEAPPGTVKKLAIASGGAFGALCALSLLNALGARGALGVGDVIFLPIYLLFAGQCFLRFGNKYMNLLLPSALFIYSAFTFLYALHAFDYHLFVMGATLIVLYSAGCRSDRRGAALCAALLLCSLVCVGLVVRYILNSGRYHDYVAGAAAMPFLILFAAVAGFVAIARKNSPRAGYALIFLLAMQLFPLAAFAAHFMDSLFKGVSIYDNADTLFYITNANFIGLTSARFPWWLNGRVIGYVMQALAFAPFCALAAARMTPGIFMLVLDENNRRRLLISSICFLIFIALLTGVLSSVLNNVL
ncbi:MAG: serine/threonine-protein kinase [Synergistaceae bacterium]|nr:serine/threonine-protein kinase [Synergistaceae bacterium]